MGTLTHHIGAYIGGRRKRGELTPRTARNIRQHLDGLDVAFGHRPLNQLGHRAVERWMESLGHLAPTTRRLHLSSVRCFCRWLVDQQHLDDDPTRKIPTVRVPRSAPRAMGMTDLGHLVGVMPDARAKAIVALMLGCGLRCVEVSRLQIADWDPDRRLVDVIGKGGHRRTLPVPDETHRAVERYLGSIGAAGVHGPLIRAERVGVRGLSPTTISTYVSRWMAAAGIKTGPYDGRSAHALRHTAASDVLDSCGDLRIVQEMLGHQHLSTTSIYLRRANLGQMREAMEGRSYLDGDPDPPLRLVA